MKKRLVEIRQTISREIDRLGEQSMYKGEKISNLADFLEIELEFFLIGVETAVQELVESNDREYELSVTDFEVPQHWEKYFLQEDPEYNQYLLLKAKFEKE